MIRLRQEAASREEKDAQYRVKVVSELLETEKTYVENLIIMMTIFKPLVSMSPVLGKFHKTIDILLHVHSKFLQSLQKRDIEAKQQHGYAMCVCVCVCVCRCIERS
jgi:RhoGEF domain